jgi:hypothetical protein
MIGALVYVGIFGLLTVGTLRKPAVGLAAALCMFVIEQWGQTKVAFVASHGSLTNYLFGSVVLLGVVSQFLRHQGIRPLNGPVHACVILLYLYSAASLTWTPASALASAIEEWDHNLPYAVLLLVLAPMLVRNIQDARDGLVAMRAAGGLLAVCFALFVEYGYRSVTSEIATAGDVRLPGALAELGGYLFIINCLLARRTPFSLAFSISFMVLGGLLVMHSGTRGQLLSMILCAGTFVVISRSTSARQRNLLLVVGSTLSALAAYFAFTELSQLFETNQGARWTLEGAESAYGGRVEMASALLDRYWSSGPLAIIFGLGTSASFAPDIAGFYSHIVPVEILGELGLVGAALFIAIVWRTVSLTLKIFDTQDPKSDDRRITTVVAALFTFELLLSLKEGSLLRGINVFLFAILLEGLALRARQAVSDLTKVQSSATSSTAFGPNTQAPTPVSGQRVPPSKRANASASQQGESPNRQPERLGGLYATDS